MIYNELNNAFRWYDSIDKQNRFKEYCENICDFDLLSTCDDLLPFQIKADYDFVATSWKLKYLDGTMEVPVITPSVDPSISFNITDSSAAGGGTIEMYNSSLGKYYGVATWSTDLNTTMLLLVDSVNNHVDHGTPVGTADYTHDFVASWDLATQVFTLASPVGSGTTWNGMNILFLVTSGFWNGDAGSNKQFTGGVNEIINYENSDTIDISDCLPFLNKYNVGTKYYLQYNGGDLIGCSPVNMVCGSWYAEITDGFKTFYSEVFKVISLTDIPFQQSILPLFTAWRWYDSEDKQTRYKDYCSNLCSYYLTSSNTQLPPFQIRTGAGATGIQSWKLVSVDGDCEILLDTTLPTLVTLTSDKRIVYKGEDITLPCGKYYSVLDDGETIWYSELIEVIALDVSVENYLQTDSGIYLTDDSGNYLIID